MTCRANESSQLRSLKYVLLPDSTHDASLRAGANYTLARSQRNRRTYFLAIYAYIVQLVFMWMLSKEDAIVKSVASKMTRGGKS